MTRRLAMKWPGRPPSGAPTDRPLRLLGVSDEVDRALDFEANREQIGPIDAVLGCGDLEPDYLCFLADAFRVPLLYVRGNHDRGANWDALKVGLPRRIDGRVERVAGMAIAGLSWPGDPRNGAQRDGLAAWWQAIGLFLRSIVRHGPTIVISHAPPRGMGDTPEDSYHRGYSAYRWLCNRLRPMLWLHGHTPLAARPEWRIRSGSTTLVNVTGAVLIEIGGRGAAP